MKIPLNEFENIIDETILKRGFSYFKKGSITAFSEISNGKYEALVSGTEDYTVQIEIANHVIEEHNCDCPYDLGPVCKHIVATIFYMQQDVLDLNNSKKTKSTKKKTTSLPQQIKELLNIISHEELRDFVQENTKIDKNFKSLFLASFGHLTQNEDKHFYQNQIKLILKGATGRDGWIGWSEMKYVVRGMEPLLANAEKYLKNRQYNTVVNICTAILEEITEAFQYADDSNGELGYFISVSMELLHNTASSKLSPVQKKELLNYCLDSFKKGIFAGWDWHFGMLELAEVLIDNEDNANLLINCLDGFHSKYEQERIDLLKLELLRKYKSEKEVQKFIDENISNYKIRGIEIEKALNGKNYERAIMLCEDGIKFDKQNRPGLVTEWYNWLLKIAQAQNHKPQIIDYARLLFLNNFSNEQDYYKILKTNIDQENWIPFLEKIIEEITSRSSWTYHQLIRKIYINEKLWDRLLVLVKENQRLDIIEENEQFLSKDFKNDLIELYYHSIIRYVKNNVGRSHYKTACRYLRRMKKLGAPKEVNDLIENFREEYPQRRALIDELTRV